MNDPVMYLKKVVHTRWLSHNESVTAIRHTLPSLFKETLSYFLRELKDLRMYMEKLSIEFDF